MYSRFAAISSRSSCGRRSSGESVGLNILPGRDGSPVSASSRLRLCAVSDAERSALSPAEATRSGSREEVAGDGEGRGEPGNSGAVQQAELMELAGGLGGGVAEGGCAAVDHVFQSGRRPRFFLAWWLWTLRFSAERRE